MQRETFRSDGRACIFGSVSGGFAGLVVLLTMHAWLQRRIDTLLPEMPLGISVSAWILFTSLLFGCLVFPAVTILLARRRTFGWPLLPLTLYFLGLVWGRPESWKDISDFGPMLLGILIFAFMAWVPFSRTVLFSGNPSLADDKSCGPRALYLVCRALGVAVTLPEVRRLTKLTAQGTTLAHMTRAAEALTLTATRLPKGKQTLVASDAPAVAPINWGGGQPNHAIALLEVHGDRALIHDPNRPWENIVSLQRLNEAIGDDLLRLSRPEAASELPPDAQTDVWPPAPRFAPTAERSRNP